MTTLDVLLIEDSASDQVLAKRAIEGLGHAVRVARSGAEAVSELAARVPDMIVTDWMVPELTGIEFTRHVRNQDLGRYVYILIVTSKNKPVDIQNAFEAGVDDYLSKPFDRHELVARLRAGGRIVDLESKLRTRVVELESALRRLDASAAARGSAATQDLTLPARLSGPPALCANATLAKTNTWQRIDGVICHALSEFISGTLGEVSSPFPDWAFASQIRLTCAPLQCELTLTFFMSRESATRIAQTLFGDDAPEESTLQDLLGEMANTAMGAVRSGLLKDDLSFTAGLPVALDKASAARALESHAMRAARVAATDDGLVMGLAVMSKERANIRVKAKDIRENMVLAKNLCNAQGAMLVAAGTRVTATLAERLAKLAANEWVEVVDPELET